MKRKCKTSAVGVSLKTAARALGVNVSTLRRDIIAGCPTVALGEVGRGRGSRVDLDDVRRWRAGRRGDALAIVESVILEMTQEAVHQQVQISPAQAGIILLKLYGRVYHRVKHVPLTRSDASPQMRRLCTICLDWVERGQFKQEG